MPSRSSSLQGSRPSPPHLHLSNFRFVKSLGAAQVFDYRSTEIVRYLADATRDKAILGCLDCVSTGNSAYDLASVLQLSSHLQTQKFISMVLPGPSDLPKEVSSKYIHGVVLKDYPGVSQHIFGHFLPEALENGSFICARPPLVSGHSLEDMQIAIDLQSRGVSATKIVVTGIQHHIVRRLRTIHNKFGSPWNT